MNDNTDKALQLLSLNKPVDIAEFVSRISDAVKIGEVPAAMTYVVIKRMEKIAKIFLADKEVREICKDDAESYLEGNEKSAIIFGAKVNIAPTYTKYDCKQSGHTELDQLYQIQQSVNSRIKEIEKELSEWSKQREKDYASNKSMKEVSFDKPSFSKPIKGNTKDFTIQSMPVLEWMECDDIIQCTPPDKIQNIGLKVSL